MKDPKDCPQDFILVHIGKCGGTTIAPTLRKHGINFTRKHLCTIQYENNEKYVLLLRNPIGRFVSAFNWRKHLVCNTQVQKHRFDGEEYLLNTYGTVNSLAERIYSKNDQMIDFSQRSQLYIHHIREDIHFYIGDFLKECDSNNIVGVIVTETIGEDMKNIFGINVTRHAKNNKDIRAYPLSDLAYKNLKKYLWKDYQCIERLFELNLISNKQYEILSH